MAHLHDDGADERQYNDNGEIGRAFSGFLLTFSLSIIRLIMLLILMRSRTGKNAAADPSTEHKVVDAALLTTILDLVARNPLILLSSAVLGLRVILIAALIFFGVLFWSEKHHACFIVHFSNANVQESKCEKGHPGLESASAGLPW